MILTSFVVKGIRAWLYFIDDGDGKLVVTTPSIKWLFIGACVFTLYCLTAFMVAKKFVPKPAHVFWIMLILSTSFTVAVQGNPRADANACFKVASEFCDGIFDHLDAGGYLDIYRNQEGLILFDYILTKLFGNYNYLAFQLFNSILISLASKYAYQLILEINQESREGVVLFVFLIFGYAPIWMYPCYLYGNLPGIAFAIMGMTFQFCYFRDRKAKFVVLSCICIALGIVFKGIALIPLIAMVLIYMYSAIAEKKHLICAFLTILVVIMSTKAVDYSINKISGNRLREDGGTSSYAWIVMGLDVDEYKIGGWFTHYNPTVYFENDYNKEKTTEASKETLKEISSDIINNPIKYIKGISNKNYSMWLEPTFAILQKIGVDHEFSISRHARWVDSIISDAGTLHRILIFWLRILQLCIYIGAIFFLVFDKGGHKPFYYLGIVAFLGGWIFYSFWEARTEYVFMFFVLLIPYAAKGVRYFVNWLMTVIKLPKSMNKKNMIPIPFILCSALLTNSFFSLAYDDEAYAKVLEERKYFTEGTYDFFSAVDDEFGFDNIYLESELVYDYSYCITLTVSEQRGHPNIFVPENVSSEEIDKVYLLDNSTIGIEKWENANDENRYHWRITTVDDGYIIRWWDDQNKVWTLNPENGEIYLSDYDKDNMNQRWRIE
ncbi:hypothetical protein [Butyrivibrio sp. Su6]|uniref:hypothetical protein n=1 Tax=Butyrivibrio sp. Su6 TaxID=1520810 RepID=UPI000CDEFCB3|nr:hypothetical protein [Butyrivibrio sp. Su6]